MNALERLKARHKARAADSAADTTKVAPKQVGVPTNVKGTVGVVTESCAGKNLSLADMLNKTKDNTSKVDAVEARIQARQEEGLYTAPDALNSLEGVNGEALMDQLRELDHAIIAKTPDIGILTIKIRKNLEQYAELTHILSDEQLGIICSGVLSVANVSTAPKTKAAKSAADTRAIKDLGATIDASMI
jgi:hypothetical protein